MGLWRSNAGLLLGDVFGPRLGGTSSRVGLLPGRGPQGRRATPRRASPFLYKPYHILYLLYFHDDNSRPTGVTVFREGPEPPSLRPGWAYPIQERRPIEKAVPTRSQPRPALKPRRKSTAIFQLMTCRTCQTPID